VFASCGCVYRRKNKPPKSSDAGDVVDKDAHLSQQPRVEYDASNQSIVTPSPTPANIYVERDNNYSRLQPSLDEYTAPYEVISELPLAARPNSLAHATKPSSPYVPLEIAHRPLPQAPDSSVDAHMLDSDGYLDLR